MSPTTDVDEMITMVTRLQTRDQLRAALPQAMPSTVVLSLPAPVARQTTAFDFAQTVSLIEDSREAATEFLATVRADRPGLFGDPFGRYVPRWEPVERVNGGTSGAMPIPAMGNGARQ